MMNDRQDEDLEALFAAARAAAPQPSAALLARVVADAYAEQPAGRADPGPIPTAGGAFRRWFAGLGGGPVWAGLASVAVAGIWIGFAQPAPVSSLTERVSEALGQDDAFDYVELIPSFDALAVEG